jgi:phenylpyruvate tautomerase PptA (4-oxalocrotonate tautomerase family)
MRANHGQHRQMSFVARRAASLEWNHPQEIEMPLVTVTVRKPKTAAFKAAVLKGVHTALVASGVPEKDRFHRVLELDADHFAYDGSYPDLAKPRDADFVLIEILLSVGRSVKVKRKILADIVAGLSADPGLDPDNVFVVFKETQWENWAFGGGRQIHI